MLSKNYLIAFLLLVSINFMALAEFRHKKLNEHISFKYENSLEAGSEISSSTTTNDAKKHSKSRYVPKRYGPFYMTMPLDHFNKASKTTFQNKYWVNTDYYMSDGPIILYNVGEANADTSDYLVLQSTMAQLAEKLHGIVVIMEHRFYGTSGPKVKTFFDNTKEDLETFNSKQALADMAYLIEHIKFRNVNVPPIPKTKAIIYGCSYSGALAAWARGKYPDVFFASIASSAPVEAMVDFYQYFDPIIRYGPKPCINAIENVISYIDNILFNGTNTQVKELKKLFNAENLMDESFAELLSNDFGGYWQYGINSTYNQFEDLVCGYFPEKTVKNDAATVRKDLMSYADLINTYTRYNYCDDEDTKDLRDCLFESNFTVTSDVSGVSDDEAAWTWQTCNEFGYYQVSAPENLPTIISRKFGLSYFANMCQKYFSKYSVPTWPDVDATNNEYQGWNVQLNRTIWIDGEWDSWRELSVNSFNLERDFSKDNRSLSIIIPKSTHCANVRMVTNSSPKYLKDALMQQYQTLKIWLATESY